MTASNVTQYVSPEFAAALGRAMRDAAVSKAFFLASSLDQGDLLIVDDNGRFSQPASPVDVSEWDYRFVDIDDVEVMELRERFPDVDGLVEANFLCDEWGEFSAHVTAFKADDKGRRAGGSVHPSDYVTRPAA